MKEVKSCNAAGCINTETANPTLFWWHRVRCIQWLMNSCLKMAWSPTRTDICHNWMFNSVALNPFRNLSKCLMLNTGALSLKSEQLQSVVHPHPMLNQEPEWSTLFQMVTKCLAKLPFFLTKILQAGYELPLLGHWSHSIPVYDFHFPPTPSLRYISLTDLASPVTMHGYPIRCHKLSSFPSLLLLMQEWKDCFILRKATSWRIKWELTKEYWLLEENGIGNYTYQHDRQLACPSVRWKGSKEEGLHNSFMCIYSKLPAKCEGSMNSVIGFNTILVFYFSGSFLHLAQGCGACIIRRAQQTRLSRGQT